MDDSNHDNFWSALKSIFRQRHEFPLEEAIIEAQEEGYLEGEDVSMLLNVLRLGKEHIHDIMVPRTDIVCAGVDESILDVCELITRHGHSRIPVYEDDKDNIVGIIYAKDLLPALVRPSTPPLDVKSIMRPILFVTEKRKVRDMLREFLSRRTHLAIVQDEYGGTSGLVTLEDVIEEIVGEIQDEHDPQNPSEIQELDEDRLLVSGRVSLEDLNERTGMSLQSAQVETLGGYLCELAGHVPKAGEIYALEGRRVVVREADRKQIRWIEIHPAQTTPTTS